MKKLLFFTAWMFAAMSFSFAQTTITGKVIDKDTQEGVIGAAVVIQGTTTGASTDLSGNFSVQTSKEGSVGLVVSFIGMKTQTVQVNANGGTVNAGTIKLETEATSLDEIQVLANIAIDRKTPVAVSTVKAELIQEKLGNQEFPEVLKSTPGVYTTKGSSGGYGDSRIALRGFSMSNIGVLVNGAPVNDMENGSVYWSNWAGLTDVTQTMQVQRGLGASKLAIPSVGGTINVITKGAEAKKGGSVYVGTGNDGMLKTALNLSTGMSEKGWAFTIAGSAARGNGYVQGNDYNAYMWFGSATKVINAAHTLTFTATGAPQSHGQRANYRWLESEYDTYAEANNIDARRANEGDAMLNGESFQKKVNTYHKPQMNLNHYWTINKEKNTALNTTLYASIGKGSGQDVNKSAGHYKLTETGVWDAQAIYDENKANGKSDIFLRNSHNNHMWVGALSQFETDIVKDLKFSGGLDLRYYKGEHYQTVADLMGGTHAIDYGMESSGPREVKEGDKMNYNYDGHVQWQGLFTQVEYSKNDLTAFVNLAGSHTGYKRVDYYSYEEGTNTSDWQSFFGGSVKGGANYNLTENHNIFANAGYFSRAPFMNSVFLNYQNDLNDNVTNEKVTSYELGYGYRSAKFNANVNVYHTTWTDKYTRISSDFNVQQPDGTAEKIRGYANVVGVDALHMGIELDFMYKPIKQLTITGMASVGDWRWKNNVENVAFTDENQNVIGHGTLYLEDLKVGDAAQTTAALGVTYEVIKGLRIGADYNYYTDLYVNFDPSARRSELGQATELADYGLFDARISYNFDAWGTKMSVYGNVYNVLDTWYIAEGWEQTDWKTGDLSESAINYGFGRTFSLGLKVKF